MAKYAPGSLDATFAALADPTRRAILAQLAEHESSVTALAEPFDLSLPAVSRHLGVLEHAGLLARQKDGRVHRCRLVADPMRDAVAWMAGYGRFWEQQFDQLDELLRDDDAGGRP
jgi:DNA-binding transcriptional ArsR family regulator